MNRKGNMNRRKFLEAAGYTFALPVLQGLIPESVYAQALNARKRLVIYYSLNGVMPPVYWPATKGNNLLPLNYMSYSPLSDFGTSLSPLLGSTFNNARSKMNIYRGLDLMISNGGHNRSNSLSCSSEFDGKNTAPRFGRTLDNIVAKSSAVYSAQPDIDVIRIQPGRSLNLDSNSWDRDASGKAVKMSLLANDQSLFDFVFRNRLTAATSAAAFASKKSRNLNLLNTLNTQYNQIKNNPALSTDGKNRLDYHMDLLQGVTARMQAAVYKACPEPAFTAAPKTTSTTDSLTHGQNVNDLILSAFNCDLTRVALISLSNLFNEHWHDNINDTAAQTRWMNWYGNHAKIVSHMVTKMDQIVEANGKTMLDNSLVIWVNEFGEGGAAHSAQCFATVTFGSAQDKLKTGYFFDFESRLYQQFNATVMQAMGLSQAEYAGEGDGSGYGEYNPTSTSPNLQQKRLDLYTKFVPDRNKPLPFVFNV